MTQLDPLLNFFNAPRSYNVYFLFPVFLIFRINIHAIFMLIPDLEISLINKPM